MKLNTASSTAGTRGKHGSPCLTLVARTSFSFRTSLNPCEPSAVEAAPDFSRSALHHGFSETSVRGVRGNVQSFTAAPLTSNTSLHCRISNHPISCLASDVEDLQASISAHLHCIASLGAYSICRTRLLLLHLIRCCAAPQYTSAGHAIEEGLLHRAPCTTC